MPRKIYLASSWRNDMQPNLVKILRQAGHEVYDFRNPAPDNTGFKWDQVDPAWRDWSPREFATLVHEHPVAQIGFRHDKDALDWCDTCVLLLPSGRSAHLEAGYAIGRGKDTIVYLVKEGFEPELMYELAHGYAFLPSELLTRLARPLEEMAIDEFAKVDSRRPTADGHRCPRRDESPIGRHAASGGTQATPDDWRVSHTGSKLRTCSYCGSVHPDEFMRHVETGGTISGTDKSYKAYVMPSHDKFYFQHLSIEQRQRFAELLNTVPAFRNSIYTLPFFISRGPKAS